MESPLAVIVLVMFLSTDPASVQGELQRCCTAAFPAVRLHVRCSDANQSCSTVVTFGQWQHCTWTEVLRRDGCNGCISESSV